MVSRLSSDEPDAEPEHDARADGDEDVDLRPEARLETPRAQTKVNDRLRFRIEPLLLDLFAGERLDDSRRRYGLLRHRRQLALFLLDVARHALDPPRETVDHREQERRDREADQREPGVQVEHHDDHADDRQRVEQDAEHRRRDEALDGVDVARQTDDHVAGPALVVERKRQPLHVMIQQMPQIEADALGDRRREEIVEVRRDRADERDDDDRDRGDVEGAELVGLAHVNGEPIRHSLRAEHVVEDDLERPRLGQAHRRFDQHRDERDGEQRPVGSK